MNILTFVLAVLCLIFLILFFLRYERRGTVLTARITKINESHIDSPQLYNSIRYYYPLITYEYDIEGEIYLGEVSKKQSRQYRVMEYDMFGSKHPSSQFFWRELEVGSEIEIIYENKNTHKSSLAYRKTTTYKSETRALFAIAMIFCVLMFLSFFFFKS